MKKINQSGKVKPLLVSTIVFALAAIGLGVLSFISASGLSTERADRDEIVATQVEEARAEIRTEEEAKFEDDRNSITDLYESEKQNGSVKLVYPRHWEAYIEEKVGTGDNINGYFHPGYVRDLSSDIRVALRVKLETKDYAGEVKSYDNDIEKGIVASRPVTISGTKGLRLDGEIDNDIVGTMVIMPLREKTLKVWTESVDFKPEFLNVVLENLTFVP